MAPYSPVITATGTSPSRGRVARDSAVRPAARYPAAGAPSTQEKNPGFTPKAAFESPAKAALKARAMPMPFSCWGKPS
jgi:hypothetical protein